MRSITRIKMREDILQESQTAVYSRVKVVPQQHRTVWLVEHTVKHEECQTRRRNEYRDFNRSVALWRTGLANIYPYSLQQNHAIIGNVMTFFCSNQSDVINGLFPTAAAAVV